MAMNCSQILDALNQASAFELFRLQSVIRRNLEDPSWIMAVRHRLQIGQVVE